MKIEFPSISSLPKHGEQNRERFQVEDQKTRGHLRKRLLLPSKWYNKQKRYQVDDDSYRDTSFAVQRESRLDDAPEVEWPGVGQAGLRENDHCSDEKYIQ